MTDVAVLIENAQFRKYLAERVVNVGNLFDEEFGNQQNAGVRLVGKVLFDDVMRNKEIPDGMKRTFGNDCIDVYLRRGNNEHSDDDTDGSAW